MEEMFQGRSYETPCRADSNLLGRCFELAWVKNQGWAHRLQRNREAALDKRGRTQCSWERMGIPEGGASRMRSQKRNNFGKEEIYLIGNFAGFEICGVNQFLGLLNIVCQVYAFH